MQRTLKPLGELLLIWLESIKVQVVGLGVRDVLNLGKVRGSKDRGSKDRGSRVWVLMIEIEINKVVLEVNLERWQGLTVIEVRICNRVE